MATTTGDCGVGIVEAPVLPGDPVWGPGGTGGGVVFSAAAVYGGIRLSWSLPLINGNAVNHVRLYRNTSNDYGTSTLMATVSGATYLDDEEVAINTVFYYWMVQVSITGTESGVYGPVSETKRPKVQDVIDDLNGQITNSHLNGVLQTSIAKIPQLEIDLDQEVTDRLLGETTLTNLITTLDTQLQGLDTLVNNEITERIDGDTAIVTDVSLIAAQSNSNQAAILNESIVRADADSALASDVTILYTEVGDNSAAIIAENLAWTTATDAIAADVLTLQATVNDPVTGVTATATALDALTTVVTNNGNTISTHTQQLTNLESTVNNPSTGVVANSAAISSLDTRVTSAEGTIISHTSDISQLFSDVAGNTASITTEQNARVSADSNLQGQVTANASSITTLQTDVAGQLVSIQNLQSVSSDLEASWYVKADVNGYIAGFGLYTSGNPGEPGVGDSEFIVKADKFAVGTPGYTDKFPFIIGQVGGQTAIALDAPTFIPDASITNAMIENATITIAKIEDIITSTNFISGVQGWGIQTSTGLAEFQDVTVRGNIEATSIKANEIIVNTENIFSNAVTVPQNAFTGSGTVDVPNGFSVAQTITVDFGSDSSKWPSNVFVIGSINFLATGSGQYTVSVSLVQGNGTSPRSTEIGGTLTSGASGAYTASFMFGAPTTRFQVYSLVSYTTAPTGRYHYGVRNTTVFGARR